jgi:putative transposase
MLEAKAAMCGREVQIINRWEPTSQKCSCCGFKGGKKELNVREWQCINCGKIHDRDINAAANIKLAGGLIVRPKDDSSVQRMIGESKRSGRKC